MLGKVSHGACSERSPLGSFAQLAHSPRIQPADGHYHSTNYLQRERAKKDGAEQEQRFPEHRYDNFSILNPTTGSDLMRDAGEPRNAQMSRRGERGAQKSVDGFGVCSDTCECGRVRGSKPMLSIIAHS